MLILTRYIYTYVFVKSANTPLCTESYLIYKIYKFDAPLNIKEYAREWSYVNLYIYIYIIYCCLEHMER